MPLEEGIGCLGMLLRVALEVVPEFILESLFRLCGRLGAWTIRGVTLGGARPDPESWTSILLGVLELAGGIVAVVYLPW